MVNFGIGKLLAFISSTTPTRWLHVWAILTVFCNCWMAMSFITWTAFLTPLIAFITSRWFSSVLQLDDDEDEYDAVPRLDIHPLLACPSWCQPSLMYQWMAWTSWAWSHDVGQLLEWFHIWGHVYHLWYAPGELGPLNRFWNYLHLGWFHVRRFQCIPDKIPSLSWCCRPVYQAFCCWERGNVPLRDNIRWSIFYQIPMIFRLPLLLGHSSMSCIRGDVSDHVLSLVCDDQTPLAI